MSPENRDLIRRMSLANPLWGAPRIHDELLKLGIEVSQRIWRTRLAQIPRVERPHSGRDLGQGRFELDP
jgi:hypothetical protein